ncbi:MAG TPA: hypothetical protein VFD58_30340 [Blastocatellia bacterium]|nr:hypothetical protein [Blastocatellia bacterium]
MMNPVHCGRDNHDSQPPVPLLGKADIAVMELDDGQQERDAEQWNQRQPKHR